MSESRSAVISQHERIEHGRTRRQRGGGSRRRRGFSDLQGMRVIVAETAAEREQAYRLRYQVYCLENKFEPAAGNPDRLETDAHDGQSVHFLLIRRDTREAVGTARLILPPRPGFGLPLPTPEICGREALADFDIPAKSAAELSRFAITKSLRPCGGDSRSGETGKSITVASPRLLSTMSMSLLQACMTTARRNGITHFYALMEPALLRMLRGLGIHFEKLGPPIDHHGRRQPCFCDLDRLLDTALSQRPEIWALLTQGGRQQVVQPDNWGFLDSVALPDIQPIAS